MTIQLLQSSLTLQHSTSYNMPYKITTIIVAGERKLQVLEIREVTFDWSTETALARSGHSVLS